MALLSVAEIERLHRESVIVDAHCGGLVRAVRGHKPLRNRSAEEQFDFHRALEGGLTTPLLAIWFDPDRPGSGVRQTLQFVDTFYREIESCGGMAVPAVRVGDILRAKEEGRLAPILSMEGVEALEGDLAALRVAYRLGLRVVGLAWNRRNEAADGAGEIRTGGGLSEFGVALVRECNRLGMVMDAAHLSPAGIRDLLEVSATPVVVSHGNCHALWPHVRNLTDAQLEAIARKGGVVGVTGVPSFLGEDRQRAPLAALLDHVDHMVKVMGEDHVGLGLDFDGVGEARIEGLEDISKLPNLTRGLVERGYQPEAVRKILGANFLRVFQEVL